MVNLPAEAALWLPLLSREAPGASLEVQLVKNPPAMQETMVQFLGQEDALEKVTATHSIILSWRNL